MASMEVTRARAKALAGMYPLPIPGCGIVVAVGRTGGRLHLMRRDDGAFVLQSHTPTLHWQDEFSVAFEERQHD